MLLKPVDKPFEFQNRDGFTKMESDCMTHPDIHPRQYIAVALLIAAMLAFYFVFVPPAPNAPLNDDWTYAQSVQHLLNDGQLRASDSTFALSVPQTYLGALFARLTGSFSFISLRWSTLLCAVICCLVLYDLLRQLGLHHAEGMLGVLVLLVNPIFINLTYTFMSDIFFLALMLLSLTCYARGFQRRSNAWLLIGSVVAACAYLERQLGFLLPVGVGAAWVLRERRLDWRPVLLMGAVPVLAVIGFQMWLGVTGKSWAPEMLAVGSTLGFLTTPVSWITIVIRALWSATYLGIFTLPALIAWLISRCSFRSTHRQVALFAAWLIVLGATSVAFVATNRISFPQLQNIISHSGLGAIILPGIKEELIPPGWLWLITLIAPLAGAVQATLWTEGIIRWRRESGSFGAGLIFVSAAVFLATILFAFFFDRYLLPLVPCAAYLVLRRMRLSRVGWLAAATVSAAFMLYTLLGMSDYLGWTTARWNAAEKLVAQGVAPESIDGGIEWVGWHEFETALPIARASGDMLAWTKVNPKVYLLAFEGQPGYEIVAVVTYPKLLTNQTGHIFVLRRQ